MASRPDVDARRVAPAGGSDARGPGAPCKWCRDPIPEYSSDGRRTRADALTCSKRCRQSSWRFRVGRADQVATAGPMRFAYADPPYPGKANYYEERQEVDHRELIGRLCREYPDGWALSTSAAALRDVLLLCPPEVRIAVWVKRARRTKAKRAINCWEPVILLGGRPLSTAVPQDLRDTLIERGRYSAFPGALIGMKPPTFAEWVFRQLGATFGDELDDLYPGSGAVTEAWRRYVAPDVPDDATAVATDDSSRRAAAPGDPSPQPGPERREPSGVDRHATGRGDPERTEKAGESGIAVGG